MEIKFLGTGGVFDYEFGNSSALIKVADQTILIDCGPSVYPTLRKADVIDSLDYILLTHLHGDHVGGLFSLILHLNLRSSRRRKARLLYASESFRDSVASFLRFSFPDLEAHVAFVPVTEARGVGYIDTAGLHMPAMQSYAYYFAQGNELIYYSGDLGDIRVTESFLSGRREEDVKVFHEMHYLEGSAHCHYRSVMALLQRYRVYAYHMDPRQLPPDNTVPLVANHPELLLLPGGVL